jgi:hypothetical protein
MTIEQLTSRRSLGGLQVEAVKDISPYFNMLVYGFPGVGKTVFAGSAADVAEMQDVVFIDIEGGTMPLAQRHPTCEVVRVKSWTDMERVWLDLMKGGHGYKTVVLDSLTEIQKFSMSQIMKEVLKEDSDRDPDVPSIREWGKNGEQTRRMVRAFRDLPFNVIFTALAMEIKDRTGLPKLVPSLNGKLSSEVAGYLDIVGYMYQKTIDGDVKRLITFQGSDAVVAKDRSDRLPQLIGVDQEVSMSSVAHFLYNNHSDSEQ